MSTNSGQLQPEADLFSRSLLKVKAGAKDRRGKLDLLAIVNPDLRARRRFLDLVRGGIESTTTLLEYDALADVAEVLARTVSASRSSASNTQANDQWLAGDAVILRSLVERAGRCLTNRERTVLHLLAEGHSAADIAPLLVELATRSLISSAAQCRN